MSSGSGSDNDIVYVKPVYRPFFCIFACIGIVLFYYSMGYAKKYSTMAAFLLPPFICFSIVFDNIIMATTGINREKTSVQTMLAFHACVTPMILLVCYEIAYLVHKQKSVNFCGISFESGHRRADRGRDLLSTFLRFAVWLIGVGLLTINMLAAYRWSGEDHEISSIYDLEGNSTAHAILSIIPALVLVVLSLYIGLQLWNYGTFYSYMVHATCFNPWIWMLVGSVSLLAGYLMPSPIYALSSNAGEVIMMATIVRMFKEVHHDMQQGQQMQNFIDPILTISPSQSHSPGSMSRLDGKFELQCNSPSAAAAAAALSGAYMEVVTPKESEIRLTEADKYGHDSAFLSVVVSSSRTNPLLQPVSHPHPPNHHHHHHHHHQTTTNATTTNATTTTDC